MIPRYEVKNISTIWSSENKFHTYLQVEIALLQALEDAGEIPKGTSLEIRNKAEINIAVIEEIEKEVHHDVIAFCSSITRPLSEQAAKFFHYGVTSSDIIDTATNLQIKESLDIILPQIESLAQSLQKLAIEHKNTLCMGRSHGISAEPMSFGVKFLSYLSELRRRQKELQDFQANELTAQFSGAVGNYTILSTKIEKQAANLLNLPVEPISSQVIPRDHIAKLFSINALLAGLIERMATEIRLLHHSDIGELAEGFSKSQKGSSTMPHKKNPIAGENLCGIARVIRSHFLIGLENMPLWHERDISHSSAERMALPDNLGLVSYAITRLTSTLENIVIHKEYMEQKVFRTFQYLSSFYLHHILKYSSLQREEAYRIVQKASFESQSAEDFAQIIGDAVPELQKLPIPNHEGLRQIFLKEVPSIYKKLGL